VAEENESVASLELPESTQWYLRTGPDNTSILFTKPTLPNTVFTMTTPAIPPDPRMAQLERQLAEKDVELAKLKQHYIAELAKEKRDNEELTKAKSAFDKEQQLSTIRSSVGPEAKERLLADAEFRSKFQEKKCCQAFVMSVDIRKSTDLMLRAVRPSDFAQFISELSLALRNVIFEHDGVFDKFTGDGILAFFPEFFSGPDAGMLSVMAAEKCHSVFKALYNGSLDRFTTARSDIGLGIGIDVGQVELMTNLGNLTVVGHPVVYACRFGGAPTDCTYLNRQAYRDIFARYSAYCSFETAEIDVKGEGRMFAYRAQYNGKEFQPELPEWRKKRAAGSDPKLDSKPTAANG
jgi:hypothetical protein